MSGSERSQPGGYFPHFSTHLLRRRAAEGRGEVDADTAAVSRLFVTQPEGTPPTPHILAAEDVVKGFALPGEQAAKIVRLIHDTRAEYDPKGHQRIVQARSRLIETMRSMTPHIPSAERQEILRRAISYWKTQHPVDLNRRPEIRVSKSLVKAKYLKRVATGDPKRPWRYIYDQGDLPTSKKYVETADRYAKVSRRLRAELIKLRDDEEKPEAYDKLKSKIEKVVGFVAGLYKRLTGKAVPEKKERTPNEEPSKPRERKETEKKEAPTVGLLARFLLRIHAELISLVAEVETEKQAAATRASKPKPAVAAQTHRVTIADSWHDAAERAGLAHVDGWGSRSVFEGTSEQWKALRAELLSDEANNVKASEAYKATANRGHPAAKRKINEFAASLRSIRAALARIAPAVDPKPTTAVPKAKLSAGEQKAADALTAEGFAIEPLPGGGFVGVWRSKGHNGQHGLSASVVRHADGSAVVNLYSNVPDAEIDISADPSKVYREPPNAEGRSRVYPLDTRGVLRAVATAIHRDGSTTDIAEAWDRGIAIGDRMADALGVPASPTVAAPTEPTQADLVGAGGGQLWEKNNFKRVYFNAGVSGLRGVKIWYDLKEKRWGSRGGDNAAVEAAVARIQARMAPTPSATVTAPAAAATPAVEVSSEPPAVTPPKVPSGGNAKSKIEAMIEDRRRQEALGVLLPLTPERRAVALANVFVGELEKEGLNARVWRDRIYPGVGPGTDYIPIGDSGPSINTERWTATGRVKGRHATTFNLSSLYSGQREKFVRAFRSFTAKRDALYAATNAYDDDFSEAARSIDPDDPQGMAEFAAELLARAEAKGAPTEAEGAPTREEQERAAEVQAKIDEVKKQPHVDASTGNAWTETGEKTYKLNTSHGPATLDMSGGKWRVKIPPRTMTLGADLTFADVDEAVRRLLEHLAKPTLQGEAPPGGWADSDYVPLDLADERAKQKRSDERRADIVRSHNARVKQYRDRQFLRVEKGDVLAIDGDDWIVDSDPRDLLNSYSFYIVPAPGNKKKKGRGVDILRNGRALIGNDDIESIEPKTKRPSRVRPPVFTSEPKVGSVVRIDRAEYIVRGEGVKTADGVRYPISRDTPDRVIRATLYLPAGNAWPMVESEGKLPMLTGDVRLLDAPPANKPTAPATAPTTTRPENPDPPAPEEPEEYENARKSRIGNAGKDVKGSARHIAMQWKGLASLDAEGADKMFTRKFLSRQYPTGLVAAAQDGTPGQALSALVLHQTISKFPPNPITGFPGVTDRESREAYLKAYEVVHGHIAAMSVSLNDDPAVTLNTLYSRLFAEYSEGSRHSNTARNYILKTLNTMKRLRDKKSIASDLVRVLESGDPDKTKTVAIDVIDGATLDKALGVKKAAQEMLFDRSSARRNVDSRVVRKGRASSFENVDQAMGDLMEKYRLRAIQWGNSVTDAEREAHLRHMLDAAEDLVDVVGLPPEIFSINGKIAMAFGARGRAGAAAHYEPGTKTINMTRKNGVGTLAHEWGHALDFAIRSATKGIEGSAFADTRWGHQGDPTTRAMEKMAKSPQWLAFKSRLAEVVRNGLQNKGIKGKQARRQYEYWNDNVECWARTFETYCLKKLQDRGVVNTYLVQMDAEAGAVGLWPNEAEMKALEPFMDEIFQTLREAPALLKSLIFGVPLRKASEYGIGQTGSAGPGVKTQSLPDFRIYEAPPEKETRDREIEAAENRLFVHRERSRGFWGPTTREPQLRYAPSGAESVYTEQNRPKLGIRKPVALPPKGRIDYRRSPDEDPDEEDSVDGTKKKKKKRES